MYGLKPGQTTAKPPDRCLRMPSLGLAAHAFRGLDRHHIPATAGEPGRVSARPGPDIEDQARLIRNEWITYAIQLFPHSDPPTCEPFMNTTR